MIDLRDQLAAVLGPLRQAGIDPAATAEALEPIVWAFAAQELRRAAEEGARQRVGLPQTWNWLRDRAGVMDGGERK